eukprot:1411553-Amphidinium_carterae.1
MAPCCCVCCSGCMDAVPTAKDCGVLVTGVCGVESCESGFLSYVVSSVLNEDFATIRYLLSAEWIWIARIHLWTAGEFVVVVDWLVLDEDCHIQMRHEAAMKNNLAMRGIESKASTSNYGLGQNSSCNCDDFDQKT